MYKLNFLPHALDIFLYEHHHRRDHNLQFANGLANDNGNVTDYCTRFVDLEEIAGPLAPPTAVHFGPLSFRHNISTL